MSEETIREIFLNADGLVKTSDITRRGFHNSVLDKLIKQGKVAKVKHGFCSFISMSETITFGYFSNTVLHHFSLISPEANEEFLSGFKKLGTTYRRSISYSFKNFATSSS